MRPLKIKMAGFGSYADETTISFENTGPDLFLITGDTGAGKTTIFDAITFALYGETSATKKENDATQLCSQYAKPGTSYVEFTFTVGSGEAQKTYTVRRTPPYMRPIKRGARKGAFTSEGSSVELSDPNGMVSTSIREVDRQLRELVGLNKEQFTQVAMLAQGEFMTFLGAKSDKKRPILRKLFGTQIFEDIQKATAEKAKEQRMKTQAAWNRISTLISQIQIPADFPEAADLTTARQTAAEAKTPDIPQAEKALRLLTRLNVQQTEQARLAAEEQAAKSEAYDQAQAALQNGQQLENAFRDAEEAAKKLAALQSRTAEMGEKKKRLENLRKAAAVLAAANLLETAQATLRQKTKDLAGETEALPALRDARASTQKEAQSAAQTAEQARLAFGQKKQEVDDALRIFDAVAAAEKRAADLEQAERAAQAESRRLRDAEQKCSTSLDAARTEQKTGQDAPLQLTRLEQAGEIARTANRQYEYWVSCDQTNQKRQTDYRAAYNRYKQQKDALDACRKKYFDNQAGLLAEQLEDGTPCPVCGSVHHPHPAKLLAGAPSKEDVEAAQAQLDQTQQQWQSASEAANEAKGALNQAKAQLDETMEKMRTQAEAYGITAADDTQAFLAQVRDRFGQLHRDLTQQVRRQKALEKTIREREQQLPQLQKQAREADERRQQAQVALSAENAQLATLRNQGKYATADEAKRDLATLTNALRSAESDHEAKLGTARQAEQKVSAAEARIKQLEEEIPSLEKTHAGYEHAYTEELQRQGFSETDWRPLATPELQKQIPGLETECTDFASKLHSASDLKDHTAGKIAGHERPDLEKFQAAAAAAKEDRDRAIEAAKEVQAATAAGKRLRQDLQDALLAHSGPAREAGRLERLSQLLSGNLSERRIDLETYVLRQYLQEILGAANRRFRKMTNGEYELRLLDYDKGAHGNSGGNAGLDLTVFSQSAQSTRNIDTLSGGESFMAALALSLGMADIIEQYSSAVQLDIMFIDEGFGSLDDNARREAVRILQGMTEGSKLVGIISHVSELKNEIDRQLIVTKDGNGSHAKWTS